MEEEKYNNYTICQNCGTYFPENTAYNKIFCSKECAKVFTQCLICGKYLEQGSQCCNETGSGLNSII